MLKIIVVSPAQGKNYYTQDDNYYLKEEVQSEWFGKGAADLGLEGSVDTEIFQALLVGKAPDGQRLHAKNINLEKHRAAYDCTFSAPKSFSTATFRDPRLLAVHREAVKTTLTIAENFAQAREWNPKTKKQEIVRAGNITVSLFPHDTSRSLDPQIHKHAVILNHTKDSQGSYRALHADGIFANRVLMDKIYLNQLAYGARELGYSIRQTKDAFEIEGYPQEFLDQFSTRRKKEIEPEVARQVANGAKPSGQLYQKVALATRSRKRDISRATIVAEIEQEAANQGVILPNGHSHKQDLSEPGQTQAAIAAQEGLNHAEERESVFRRGKVEQFALDNHLGQQSWEQLQEAIDNLNQLVSAEIASDKYTTQRAIERERDTIRLMNLGKSAVSEIATVAEIAAIASEHLTKGQRQAIELTVTSCDRVTAWQGVAGAGKTYALNLYCQLAEAKGYTLRGFAPSAESAKVLGQEIGIESDTVASLIHAPKTDSTTNPEVWIIDEAGLLSAKDAHALLQRATDQQVRILLVGDTRQLSAVESGNPFKSLQAAGMLTAKLNESLRQKTEGLKLAVDAIARGDIGSGFHHLYQSNAIQGVRNQAERQQHIVNDYLTLSPQQRAKTLIISNTNAERLAITQGIREGLQVEGKLGADTFNLVSLKPRDLTTAQAKYVKNYAQGDILIPLQDYRKQSLVKGEQYEIVGFEPEANRLTLRSGDGDQFTINPVRCDRKTVYELHQVPLAVGDQLRWTRNDRTWSRRNGQQFTINAIDEFGQAIVRYDDRTTEFLDLNGRQFADYAIVQTTYSSQGKSADRVLVALDGSTGKESFYVAASRARHHLSIYTTDEAQLRKLAECSRANENASDYLNLFTYQPHQRSHAQNKTQPPTTNDRGLIAAPTHYSADRGISAGNRAAKRLTASLQRDCRTQTGTSDLERCLENLNRSNSVSGIETDPIVDTIANFIDQETLCRNGATIASAFESIATNLEQFERVSQQLRERNQESSRGVVIEAVSETASNDDVDIDAIIAATSEMDVEDLFASIRALYGDSVANSMEVNQNDHSSEEINLAAIDKSASEFDVDELFASILSQSADLTESNQDNSDDLLTVPPENEFPAPTLPASVSILSEQIIDTSTWAAEIAEIATRLFDYYAVQEDIEFEVVSRGELLYEIGSDDQVYWLSWNESTNECHLRGKGREFDVRLNRGITEQDLEIWHDWRDWLDQQITPIKPIKGISTDSIVQSTEVQAVPQTPLTLETAIDLTAQDWLDLTPRQQINLAVAARQHRATQPQGYTQPEQWVGQRSQLEKQLRAVKLEESEAKKTLKDIKERGQRSLINPWGATSEQQHNAKLDLSSAKRERQQLEAELKEIDDRYLQRERQDAARQEWSILPRTQGAQRVLALLTQPALEAQFQEVERTDQQMSHWLKISKLTPEEENVRATVTAYLDGHGLSLQSWEMMQCDLAKVRQQDRQITL